MKENNLLQFQSKVTICDRSANPTCNCHLAKTCQIENRQQIASSDTELRTGELTLIDPGKPNSDIDTKLRKGELTSTDPDTSNPDFDTDLGTGELQLLTEPDTPNPDIVDNDELTLTDGIFETGAYRVPSK